MLRWFAHAVTLDPADARDMAGWDHGGGFSLDASVRIDSADRAGLERLLRYCARPPFALERLEQVAAAFINDIGLSSPVYPDQNCPDIQMYCKEQMVAGKPEITALRLAATETYVRALSVPARRNLDDPKVTRGEQVFGEVHCVACHVPELRTGEYPPLPQLANQTIHPYTDLLVHDMGADLADGRPDYLAGGSEWRTPPLWGIGLSEKVNGAGAFLHDGRAQLHGSDPMARRRV